MTEEGIEKVGKPDLIWSYAATLFQVGTGIFLLPFILSHFSDETVAIWSVFQTVSALVLLLDFGFRPSFARDIGFIFSGVRTLQKNGVSAIGPESSIDYTLLKSAIRAMQHFYRRMSALVLLLLATLGTAYFYYNILQKYSGDQTDALLAWILLCLVNCYELYTYYYDSLMLGKGYVRQSQKIMVLSRLVYLSVAIALVYAGLGLCAIVTSQMVGVILRRVLAHRVFFTAAMKSQLAQASSEQYKEVLSSVAPNAVKVGLTYLGGFCINKSAVLMGAVFIPLEQMAAYGVTWQVMDVLGRCGTVLFQAWTPKIVKARAKRNLTELWKLFRQCVGAMMGVMAAGGTAWLLLGNRLLELIHSDTMFIPTEMLLLYLLFQILEKNHSIAAGFIQADNRIPFFIPSLVSGGVTLLLIWLLLDIFDMGLWGIILAPGIVQLCYQNWKWPWTLYKELNQNCQ